MRLRVSQGLLLLPAAVMIVTMVGCNAASAVMGKGNLGASTGTGFMIKTVHNEDRNRKYAVFIPHAYKRERACPAIVFLHGVGEGGTDAEHNLTVGLAPVVAERAANFPFIVVFPQSASGHWDEDSNAAADAIAALDQVERDYNVDRQRVFLTGLSTGGYGTWAIGAKYKEHFAGLVPMCSYPDFKDVDRLVDMPVWCFHNSGDPFALAAGAHAMCNQINERGGKARYTEYFALGHDVWIRAYQKDELYQWMLETRKGPAVGAGNRPTISASAMSTSSLATAPLPPAPTRTVAPAVMPAVMPPVAAPARSYPVPPVAPAPTVAPAAPQMPTLPPPAAPARKANGKADNYVPMVW